MLTRGASFQMKTTPSNTKLSSLLERDESPNSPQLSIDALVSSPIGPSHTAPSQGRFNTMASALSTPQTASRIRPPREEMHPSKTHHSTTKIPAFQSPLSSHPVNDLGQTPSKASAPLPRHMTSPTFDFSFERPESDLSAEAQKIMDSVREEAAKIKAQMKEEQNKQKDKDGEFEDLCGTSGRQIAKAKGKAGRYSDVHKQEFKKMESIANHPSAWKSKLLPSAMPLKRSPSKAGLDEAMSISRSKSFKSFHSAISDRLENTSPGKRAKCAYEDDTSIARPISRDTNKSFESTQTTPAKTRPVSGLPSAVTTPTKASLARSASVKSFKTSMIPSLGRSASTKTLSRSPTMPKTEGSNNKYMSSLSRFGSMKSILHRSQPKFSTDPSKIAAGTHLPPQTQHDTGKGLPSLPASPSMIGLQRTPTIKRVGFAPTILPPSPSKIPTPHSKQPTTPTPSEVSYPLLANSPNVTTRVKPAKPSTPADFTFRSAQTLSFTPAGLSSPNSTIRHVRPSGISTPLPTYERLPAIPHGISNKKRKHTDSDSETEEPDTENVDPNAFDHDSGGEEDGQPQAKKQRRMDSHPPQDIAGRTSPIKTRKTGAGSRIPQFGKGKGRVGLTLGRLNALARPKERR